VKFLKFIIGHFGDEFYRLHIPTNNDEALTKDKRVWRFMDSLAVCVGMQPCGNFQNVQGSRIIKTSEKYTQLNIAL